MERAGSVVFSMVLLCHHGALGSHNEWWRCTSECEGCHRKMAPLIDSITLHYRGLFSRQPPETLLYSGANPTFPGRHGFQNTPAIPDTPGRHGDKRIAEWGNCCETDVVHMILNSTDYEGRNYTVVHLTNEYQFVPVGRCRNGATCTTGRCFQRYRPHWILVFNATRSPTTHPLSFIPTSVPSHCECVDVMTQRP